MNNKGFAISVVLYSIVFLLISILYMILGVLKVRYHVESDLREAIVEQLNNNLREANRCIRLTGVKGTLAVGDAFVCDVNDDGIYNEATEKFYYISNYYKQSNKTFDTNTAALIHSLNSFDGSLVGTNSPVQWSSTLSTSNGPIVVNANFANNWSGVKLKANPRSIFLGYGSSGNTQVSYQYTRSARLLTVEEYNSGCNPASKCEFLFNEFEARVGNGLWLENIQDVSESRVYILDSTTHELGTNTVTSTNMARAVIDVPKRNIAY